MLLNIADYWRPLLELIEQGIEQQFIKPKARNYYYVAVDVPDAIDYLRRYVRPATRKPAKDPSAAE